MFKFQLALFPLMLGLSYTALAQVYKSTDADGNVIYSDTPATDSEEVEITSPNISDPVEVPTDVTAPEPEPKAVKAQQKKPEGELAGEVYVKDDDGRKHLRDLRPRQRMGPANPQK
jgi:hypothetical protein